MNYIIRKLRQEEVKCLDTFLYEAIFIPGSESINIKLKLRLIDYFHRRCFYPFRNKNSLI